MIGYLGPEGTFTQAALRTHLSKNKLEMDIVPYESIKSLFDALLHNDINEIFIPIENSRGGEVFSAYEGLSQLNQDYQISYEVVLDIHQSLMAKSKLDLQDINCLYAHEQSIRQCDAFIQEYLTDVEVIYCSSNAHAAELVSKDKKNAACLGHVAAMGYFDLVLLKENIQDNVNVTRFIGISLEKPNMTHDDKTSIVFSTQKDVPGSLCNVLSVLSKNSINLTRISSKPQKKLLGEYLFFLDFEGHQMDKYVSDCLDFIEKESSYFRLLGSYPKAGI